MFIRHSKIYMTLMSAVLASSFTLTACGDDATDDKTKEKVIKTNYSKVFFKEVNSFSHGGFDESAAEITDYHPKSKQAFIVNAFNKKVDVLDYTVATSPILKQSLDVSNLGDSVNSVAVHDDLVAVAVQAKKKTDNGFVVIYDANTLQQKVTVEVGSLPDMITFTPDGRYVLVANEGEPEDYRIDPEGSVSIINISNINNPVVRHVGFTSFNDKKQQLKEAGVRIFGKLADGVESTVAQDLEPEYIAVSSDSNTAYVSLQENNAMAIIDVSKAMVTDIKSFGYKDHSVIGNEIDPSNKDKKINISNFPVMGMYQPDAIAIYEVADKPYIVTANEGDGREWGDFSDETKVGKLKLDPTSFPASVCGGVECRDDKALGKLKVTNSMGDTDNDGDYDVLYAYGARSFSIWNPEDMSQPVFDSGSQLAKLIAQKYPNNFNASNDDNELDDRSDNKGIEPEGVTIGKIGSQTIAFIGLERISSVVAYDITDPMNVKFMGEINTRTFDDDLLKSAKTGEANADGDLGPEGLHFISGQESPIGKPALIVGYEVSGTSRLYELNFIE